MHPQERVFHPFPRLPPELRRAIWCECLPHRVVELQRPLDSGTFSFQERGPCKLALTTCKNSRPPAISRVCRESRAVASETGAPLGRDPDGADRQRGRYPDAAVRDPWLDAARDVVVHMHYEKAFDMDFGPGAGNPLRYAAAVAARTRSGRASFNLLLLLRPSPDFKQMTDLFRLRPSWLVVVYVVVVHVDPEAATATGLFGLLGDAPVQIVDLRDEARVKAFNDLALANDKELLPGQHLDDESLDQAIASMEYALAELYREEPEPAPAMYPAVMFRLCTERC
ncbi:hypothetical protein F4820DRAFT_405237 [Hypoxylon rubiginosum]|uniref:Uncharacterized protein n=1 Tax=Hypoxylon rubiginosum TaxID=110542 RepID=A0ACB9ZDL9_9PEZI|nr:hypothetical protein F4820DRAFT_405237 [Hypoxylon rubiginosum]